MPRSIIRTRDSFTFDVLPGLEDFDKVGDKRVAELNTRDERRLCHCKRYPLFGMRVL
jgi:hypothetical protein